MEQHNPLARLTLDTLPINIAVLDSDGTILFTNEAWDNFGAAAGAEESDTGKNYFAGIDMSDSDETVPRSVEGIQSVIDGEQSLFTMEYPCDTPEESLWFLMRVVPLSEDGDRVVVAHIDITERKLAELRAEERARELRAERQHLEHLIRRINGLVRKVMEGLMAAETVPEVQQTVCDQFAETSPYVRAWVAEYELGAGRLTPAAWSGEEPVETTIDIDQADDQASLDPIAMAAQRREIQVESDVSTLPAERGHRDICPDAHSMAAVPLVADNSLYGVLTVYADEANAFDERETVILEALGRSVATAIDAIERKRILTADTVLEVELAITETEEFPFGFTRREDCRLEYAGSVHREDSQLLFFLVEDVDPESLLARAREDPAVIDAAVVSTLDSGSLVEIEMADPPIVGTLAALGAETRSLIVSDGQAELEAYLPPGGDVRGLVNTLAEQFDSVDLVSVQERDRPTQTSLEFVSSLMDSLTERQRTALQKAYVGGFFEWPRATSGEELAASMDISPSTYHQHLRAAERKLVTEFFER